jgi:two-component system chemotaxis response regulator CheY
MNTDLKVLVVDDMGAMRKVVTEFVKDMGFTDIIDASDGKDAIKKLENDHFELIISDLNMPETNGLDLLEWVRGSDHYANTPFIMLTAESEKHLVVAALKGGADNYIIKPVDKDVLQSKIEATLEKRQAA